MHPLGPVLDDVIPALVADGLYSSDRVIEWSKLVGSCQGFMMLSPQYHWGYPGDMKNALDHLYKEWLGKPAMLVTYGGHGGGKCDQQLRQVLEGLHMKVVPEKVNISLSSDCIRTSARVTYESDSDPGSFLETYTTALDCAIDQFRTLFVST